MYVYSFTEQFDFNAFVLFNFQILNQNDLEQQWQTCGRLTENTCRGVVSSCWEEISCFDWIAKHQIGRPETGDRRERERESRASISQHAITMYQEIHHTLKLADSNQYEQKSTAKICTCNKCHNNSYDICFYVPFCTIFVCLGLVQIISGIFYFITIPVIKLIFNVAIGCWVRHLKWFQQYEN